MLTAAVRAIFDRYDSDGSGTIDHGEFRGMLKDLGVEMTRAEFQEAVTMLDTDSNGRLDFKEIKQLLARLGDPEVVSDETDDRSG